MKVLRLTPRKRSHLLKSACDEAKFNATPAPSIAVPASATEKRVTVDGTSRKSRMVVDAPALKEPIAFGNGGDIVVSFISLPVPDNVRSVS